MSTRTQRFFATLAALASISTASGIAALASFPAQAGEPAMTEAGHAVVVKDYDVFVDPPTAFAFIKLPDGWKFIGKLDASQMRQLPPGTLTSLLSDPAAAGNPRVLLAGKGR